MNTINTVPGRTYAVTTTRECTITTPEEIIIATCPAGVQTLFVASGTEAHVSDDSAVVTESFNGASAGSSAGGGVQTLYTTLIHTPPDGNLDNYDAYGWAMVVPQSGRLDTITVQPRSSGTIKDLFPVYLKIWTLQGNQWILLGTSSNAVTQTMGTPFVWQFHGVQLVAEQKIHIDVHKTKETMELDARLSARVVANTSADTGMIDWDGSVRVTAWVPQYALALSRPAGLVACGVELAVQSDLAEHARDALSHVTAEERESWNHKTDASAVTAAIDGHGEDSNVHISPSERLAWNGKAESSALGSKVNTATFNAHTGDTVKHVTAAERTRWNELSGGGVMRAEMEAYVAEYVAAHVPAIDLEHYLGPIHLRDEAGNDVLRVGAVESDGYKHLYLGHNRFDMELGPSATKVVISAEVSVPVYGVHAGSMSVDTSYKFGNSNNTAAAISYVGNEVRIMHGSSHIDVGATGVSLSVNGGLSKLNIDSTNTSIENSRVTISSNETYLREGSATAYPAGDLRVGDNGRIISQP